MFAERRFPCAGRGDLRRRRRFALWLASVRTPPDAAGHDRRSDPQTGSVESIKGEEGGSRGHSILTPSGKRAGFMGAGTRCLDSAVFFAAATQPDFYFGGR